MATRRQVLIGTGAVAIRAAGRAAAPLASTAAPLVPVRTAAAADGWQILRAQPDPGGAGGAPGPTLRVKRGEEVRVRLVNDLSRDTALHWHGVRLANAMDGVPGLTQPPVAPGASFDYRFTPPDAGTFWYHPHRPDAAPGPFGALIVEETEPPAVDRDLVVLLGDGPDGTGLTVDGGADRDIAVRANERIRLRLINATRSDAAAIRFDRHQAIVMAIDGQPAEPFAARDGRVALGPGNRADVFIDLTLAPGTATPLTLSTAGGERPVGRLVYGSGPPARSSLPDPKPLPANPLPARIDLRNAQRLNVPVGVATKPWIDGAAAGSGRYDAPAFAVKRGRVVVLAFANQADTACALHLHGHHARLLDNLDDGWKPFWFDTVVVPPRQTARIAFVADNSGKWLIEQQALQTGGAVSVTWFEVT